VFGAVGVNYTLVLNVVALLGVGVLFLLTFRRGETDPICGMTVDRAKALTAASDGTTVYFCSEHCLRAFEASGRGRQAETPEAAVNLR
jgi:YHS domain-containing protein